MITFNTKVSREAQGLEKAPVVLKGASVFKCLYRRVGCGRYCHSR